MWARLYHLWTKKLFGMVIALSAVGLQLLAYVLLSEAVPKGMLASILITFTAVTALTYWIGHSTRVGVMAAIIAISMKAIYDFTLWNSVNYGQLSLLGASIFFSYWIMHRIVMEGEAGFSEQHSRWFFIVITGISGLSYTLLPLSWIEQWGYSLGASLGILRFIGVMFLILCIGLLVKQFKILLFDFNMPNELLARFFRVLGVVVIVASISTCLLLSYKFLYMYGQNMAVGNPGWVDVSYNDAGELLRTLAILGLGLAVSVGLVAFKTAEAATGALLAAAGILLWESMTGNFMLTVQQFLVNGIIFCLSALMVLETKGETIWQ